VKKIVLWQEIGDFWKNDREQYKFEFSHHKYKNFQDMENLYIGEHAQGWKNSVECNYVLLCPNDIFKKTRKKK
jgi:hypothetical protein